MSEFQACLRHSHLQTEVLLLVQEELPPQQQVRQAPRTSAQGFVLLPPGKERNLAADTPVDDRSSFRVLNMHRV